MLVQVRNRRQVKNRFQEDKAKYRISRDAITNLVYLSRVLTVCLRYESLIFFCSQYEKRLRFIADVSVIDMRIKLHCHPLLQELNSIAKAHPELPVIL